jgi:hypothetical protein
MLSLISTLLVVGNTAVTAWGADLTKIDRTIAKEPAYATKPKYCLLVFGPEAKTRVWLVMDGAFLYVDRNGNGDLTEPDEKVVWQDKRCEAGKLTCLKDKAGRTDLLLQKYGAWIRMSLWHGDKEPYMIGDPHRDPLEFADRVVDAPIAHIGGPLSFELIYHHLVVKKRPTMIELRVRVGTPGLGKGAFAARLLRLAQPVVYPEVELECPAMKAGQPPVVAKAKLNDH